MNIKHTHISSMNEEITMTKAKQNFIRALSSDYDFNAINGACVALLDAITDEYKMIDRTFFDKCLHQEMLRRQVVSDARVRAEDAFVPIKQFLEELLYHATEQSIADEGCFCIPRYYDEEDIDSIIFSKKSMKKYGIEVYDAYKDFPSAIAYLQFGLKGKLKKVFDDNGCHIQSIEAIFHGRPGDDCFSIESMSEHSYALQELKVNTQADLDAYSLMKLEKILITKHKCW